MCIKICARKSRPQSTRKPRLSAGALAAGTALYLLSAAGPAGATDDGVWDGANYSASSGDTYESGNNWNFDDIFSSVSRNPQPGDALTMYRGSSYYQPASAGTNLVLSNSSDDGQSLTIDGGTLNAEYGMEVDDGGSLGVAATVLNVQAGLNIGNSLGIGETVNQSTTVTLQSGGTIVVGMSPGMQDRNFYDGLFGNGTVTQSGGALYCDSNLNLADESGSNGTYTFSGGYASVVGSTSLGGNTASAGGSGVFNMSNGLMQTGSIKIWDVAGTEFYLSGGDLQVQNGALDTSGNASLFDWTGGELDLDSQTNEVKLDATGLLGSTISIGSTQKLVTGFTVYVGYDSPAAMTISSGGTFNSYAGGGSVIVTNVQGANGSNVTIDGAGSAWNIYGSGNMRIGAYATGTLTVQNHGSFSSQIAVGLGYNNINGVGTGDGFVNVESGGTFSASNGLYIGGSPNASAGTGTFSQTGGTVTVTGTTEIWNSASSLSISLGTLTSGTLQNFGSYTQSGGTATFSAVHGSGQIAINGGLTTLSSNGGQSDIGSLSITGSGALDITNNHFLIEYGTNPDPISAIRDYLVSGYNGGGWNGTGLISSAANLTQASSSKYALGYADSADPGNPANLPADTVEVKYTLVGDLTLAGAVSGQDFAILAGNFNSLTTPQWDAGDVTYDGAVSGADFAALAANFGKLDNGESLALSAADWAAFDAFSADQSAFQSSVPEPASAALCLTALTPILLRRHKKQ